MSSGVTLKSGPLKVKANTNNKFHKISSWQKRFCILESDKLWWQKRSGRRREVTISLLNICAVSRQKRGPLVFELIVDDHGIKKTYQLKAENEDERTKWVKKISVAMKKQKQLQSFTGNTGIDMDDLASVIETVHAPVESSLFEGRAVIYQGRLTKLGGNLRNWNERYFVLDKRGNLSYYKPNQLKDAKGKLRITKDVEVKKLTDNSALGKLPRNSAYDLIFAFTIKCKDRLWYFVAETEENQNAWIGVLKDMIMVKSNKAAWIRELTSKGYSLTQAKDAIQQTAGRGLEDANEWLKQNEFQESDKCIRSGFLIKVGKNVKSFKRRYFQIIYGRKKYTLTYSKNERSPLLQTITLSTCSAPTIEQETFLQAKPSQKIKEGTYYPFIIRDSLVGRNYKIFFLNQKKRDQWVQDLTDIIQGQYQFDTGHDFCDASNSINYSNSMVRKESLMTDQASVNMMYLANTDSDSDSEVSICRAKASKKQLKKRMIKRNAKNDNMEYDLVAYRTKPYSMCLNCSEIRGSLDIRMDKILVVPKGKSSEIEIHLERSTGLRIISMKTLCSRKKWVEIKDYANKESHYIRIIRVGKPDSVCRKLLNCCCCCCFKKPTDSELADNLHKILFDKKMNIKKRGR